MCFSREDSFLLVGLEVLPVMGLPVVVAGLPVAGLDATGLDTTGLDTTGLPVFVALGLANPSYGPFLMIKLNTMTTRKITPRKRVFLLRNDFILL